MGLFDVKLLEPPQGYVPPPDPRVATPASVPETPTMQRSAIQVVGPGADTNWTSRLTAKSPYEGLGADDRIRLESALGDVNRRFEQNIADIDMQEQLMDPRRQEIQEAQILHAQRSAGRLGGEDELADIQLGTAIDRAGPGEDGYTLGETLAQMPEKQQKAFGRAQMQDRHASIMGVVEQIEQVMAEATAEHNQHPGEGWSPAMRQMLAPLLQMLNTYLGVSTPGAMWTQAGETEAEGFAAQNPNAPAQNPAQR